MFEKGGEMAEVDWGLLLVLYLPGIWYKFVSSDPLMLLVYVLLVFVISMGQGTYQDRQLLCPPHQSFNQIKELDRSSVNLPLLKSPE